MAVIGTIEYIAKINTSDYDSGAKKIEAANKSMADSAEKSTKKMDLVWRKSDKAFGTLVKSISAGALVAGAAIGAIAVSAIKSAGELEQQIGGSEAVFGQYSKSIQDSARSAAQSSGLTMNEFLANANKQGSLLRGVGFDVQTAMKMSEESMQRATDVASIMGITNEQALEAVTGAAKGNFTMMDNLGVAMNDTTLNAYALEKGLGKTTQQMTLQEKIGLAHQLFMEKTAYAAGNYAKENDTLAGSMTTLNASWGNFLAGVEGSDKQLADAIGNVIAVFGEQIPQVLGQLSGLVQNLISDFLEANPQIATALEVFKQVATVIGILLIPQLIRYIALQTMAGVQALIAGAKIAAGWLLALGPIGLIIAIVAAAAALIIMNWEHIKNFAIAVWEWIKEAWGAAAEWFGGIWEGIKNAFSAVGQWFKDIFQGAWNAIKGVFSAVGGFFRGVWDTIKSIFTNIGSSIGNAIGGAFKFVVNSIINFAENTINGFIRAINGAIGLINKIPGVNIGTIGELAIPRLAKGGITTGSTIANIGEAGTEAVLPLENNTGWMDDLAAKIDNRSTVQDNTPVVVNLSHSKGVMRQAAMDTLDLINETFRSRGMPEIGVTG